MRELQRSRRPVSGSVNAGGKISADFFDRDRFSAQNRDRSHERRLGSRRAGISRSGIRAESTPLVAAGVARRVADPAGAARPGRLGDPAGAEHRAAGGCDCRDGTLLIPAQLTGSFPIFNVEKNPAALLAVMDSHRRSRFSTTLSLHGPAIDDAWLARHAAAIRSLRRLTLNLDHCPITHESLSALRGASNIRTLTLNYLNIGDEGLRSLGRLPQLRYVDVIQTQATADGLAGGALRRWERAW